MDLALISVVEHTNGMIPKVISLMFAKMDQVSRHSATSIGLCDLIAEDIGVAGVEDSHRAAPEQLTTSSAKLNLRMNLCKPHMPSKVETTTSSLGGFGATKDS